MNPLPPDRRLQEARAAYEAGDLRHAIRIIQHRLSENPEEGRAWELCGLIHYAAGHFLESLAALEQATTRVPLRPSGRVCIAHAYARIGRSELARDLLVHLIKDNSVTPPLLLQVASGLNELNRPELAVAACREAIRRNSDFAQAYYEMGIYARRCRSSDEMVESLARKAIELAPEEAGYRIGLASLLQSQGRSRDAWKLVRYIAHDDLISLRCTCSLEQLASLFDAMQDSARAMLCRRRLEEIRSRGEDCDCQ